MSETGTPVLKKFGETIKVEPITKELSLNSFDLVEDAKDSEIEAALGENHLFEINDVFALIGNLMAKQSEGQEGALLNNGNYNLFYITSCVVHVGWDGFYGGWYVDVWGRGGLTWRAGERVFSPAN